MNPTDGLRNGRAFHARIGRAALLICLAALPRLHAQGPPTDPVEGLRIALATTGDPARRDQMVREGVDALHGIGELRRALALAEWRDGSPESGLAAVDGPLHKAVAERFLAAARDMLRRKDAATVNLALDMLVEMASEAQPKGGPVALPRTLTPEIVALVQGDEPRLRLLAARALGLIDPDPAEALPVLGGLFQTNDPYLHRAAAEGLANLLQPAAAAVASTASSRAERRAAVVLTNTVLSNLQAGCDDGLTDVRNRCLTAAGRTVVQLHDSLNEPPAREMDNFNRRYARARLEDERADLRPLVLGARDLLPALARALRDEDVDVRLTALGALEAAARVHGRWLRQGEWLDGPPRPGVQPAADDPLAEGMRTMLPALARVLTDSPVRVRRAALDVLEVFGAAAAPAAPAVARALADEDRFVRWSAVRALEAIGEPALPAIPALAKLVEDEDVDVARAAVEALVCLDPTGRGAPPTAKHPEKNGARRNSVPALARAVKAPDATLRIAAVHALQGMGENARPAVPALCAALGDPEVRVRHAAAGALGVLGPVARDAVPDLNLALKDANPTVRRAAGDALLRIRQSAER